MISNIQCDNKLKSKVITEIQELVLKNIKGRISLDNPIIFKNNYNNEEFSIIAINTMEVELYDKNYKGIYYYELPLQVLLEIMAEIF